MLPASLRNILSPVGSATESVASAARTATRQGTRWLVPAIIALLIAMALMWLFARRRGAEPFSAARDAASGAAHRLGSFIEHKLPSGVSLRIPQHGVENRLVAFIEDASQPVSRELWFDFDRLRFDTNSATLQPESQEQLRNVSEIMKAYPNVQIKIGGYTDNVGNSDDNLRLSAARANNVRNELIAMGVDPSRVVAEGYGDQHPVADNSTEEGRARNRRISIRILHK